MTIAKSEAVGFLVAREATAGTAPSSGWAQFQPNPGGLAGTAPELVSINRDPLSKLATDEKGDHVGLNVNVTLTHDLNKDFVDMFGDGFLRSVAKVPGDEPTTMVYRPSAAADGGGSQDSFTVSADGDLANGLIVVSRGFANSANNGIFVLEGTSGSTAIKVPTATLVAETVSPAGSATVEVCGVQGTSGDIAMNSSGHLTSSSLDFTTLGLVDGHRIKIGGSTAGTQFATAALNGWATVSGTPTANLITLKWHSFAVSADTGTSKTIQLFFGRCYRNVAIDHADYREPSWHAEVEDIGPGTANASVFTYLEGLYPDSFQIAMPVQSKIVVTASFKGMNIEDPVLSASRVSGPSSAYPPVATELFDTSNDLIECRVLDTSNNEVIASINSFTLTFQHTANPRTQLATFGAAGMKFGKIRVSGQMEIYYEDDAVPVGIRANTTYRTEAIMKNGQAGIVLDIPAHTLRGGQKTYAANEPVMMALDLPAHRDSLTNQVGIVNLLPYVPA